MTDRVSHLTVVLRDNVREDDAEAIAAAILMVKGVQAVEPHIEDADAHIARMRAVADLGQRVTAAVNREVHGT